VLPVHAWQLIPPKPHVALDDVAHWPAALQQPAQEMPPQEHAPAAHVWPVAHAPQPLPWLPHVELLCADCATHTLPWQQPLGHDAGSHVHAPETHSCPGAHAPQAAPPIPHCVVVGAVTHVSPAQQPVGHELGVH
jgi:hypothetical protein